MRGEVNPGDGSLHMTRRRFLAAAGVGYAAGALALAGCAAGAQAADGASGRSLGMASATAFAFDTVVTLRAACDQALVDALVERCAYFESIFSRTVEGSDVGRINAAGGAPVSVASETVDLIGLALGYCAESQGLFDITIGAVSSLWDFKAGAVPDADALAGALAHVDWRNVILDDATVTLLDPQARLDLGGIAKGYIADDLCRTLVDAGCESACVNLGGNVKTIGMKPDGAAWRVGVQDPDAASGVPVAAIESQGGSVVTSGLYERAFELDGRRYWHILDPRTGYPVETDLVSATIVSTASIDGDGYTKPLFMMGFDGALAWMDAREGIEGLVMADDGRIGQTAGCQAELL